MMVFVCKDNLEMDQFTGHGMIISRCKLRRTTGVAFLLTRFQAEDESKLKAMRR